MYGVAASSEASSIEIGECTIICENTVIRASETGETEHPVRIVDHVFVGPHCTILGCTLQSYTYIGTGVTLLQGSEVRSGAIVAVGALVHAGTVIPEGLFIPPGSVAIGDPVKIFSPDDKEEIVKAIRSLNYPLIAFGIDSGDRDRESIMKMITETRSREFKAHFDDRIIEPIESSLSE